MGYVDKVVKYRFANGVSVFSWCMRNGASYIVARDLIRKGVPEKEIKKRLKEKYTKASSRSQGIDYLVYETWKKYQKARNAAEIDAIRRDFFSHSFGETTLSQAWDKVVLSSKIEAVVDDPALELWKAIKDSHFEVSNMGNFRKKCKTFEGYAKANAFPQKRRNKKGEVNRFTLAIKIGFNDGTNKTMSAAKLVATYFVHNPKGYGTTYLKNGNWQDIRASNIIWVSEKQKGELTGYSKKLSKEVILFDDDGKQIEVYRSARAAAKDLFVSYQTVLNACHGRQKNPCVNVKFKKEDKRKCMQNTSS